MRPDGQPMTEEDWGREDAHALGAFLNGAATDPADDEPEPGDSLLILVNAHHEGVEFVFGDELPGPWDLVLATDEDAVDGRQDASTILPGRSLRVLRAATAHR
jgi:glycogen operon protein